MRPSYNHLLLGEKFPSAWVTNIISYPRNKIIDIIIAPVYSYTWFTWQWSWHREQTYTNTDGTVSAIE